METDKIIAEVDAEIEKLQQARALILGTGKPGVATQERGGRRASTGTQKKTGRRRRLSPEARKRIAEAQRKRWAKVKQGRTTVAKTAGKKAGRKAAKKAAPKKAAARKASPKKAAPVAKQESSAPAAS
jgi:hypothetical protein